MPGLESKQTILGRRWVKRRTLDVAKRPVYQTIAEIEKAQAEGALDANKLQFQDASGKIYFLCYG